MLGANALKDVRAARRPLRLAPARLTRELAMTLGTTLLATTPTTLPEVNLARETGLVLRIAIRLSPLNKIPSRPLSQLFFALTTFSTLWHCIRNNSDWLHEIASGNFLLW